MRWCLVILLVTASPARADRFDERFFDGLRDRRLFGLAEGYCLERIADDRLEPTARAEFVIELSRTFAEHGRYVEPGDERDELWRRATGVLDEHLATNPPPVARLRVELQRALVPAGLGEFLARWVEIEPYDSRLRTRAAARLDAAITQLVALETRLAEIEPGPMTASTSELRSAEYNVRFRLAVTRLDRAGLYEEDDPNRTELLAEASKSFNALAGGEPGNPTTQRCHVLLARTWRMQGRPATAARPIEKLLSGGERLAADVRDEAEAERATITLVLGRPDEAAEFLRAYATRRGRLPGELRLVMARALIGMWQAARELDRPELSQAALDRLKAHVTATETEVGGYWAVRCRVLLENTIAASEYGPELAHVLREADGRFRAGRIDDAVAGYERAIVIATGQNRVDLAARFRFTRGSILLESDRHAEAAAAFTAFVEAHPDDERAPRGDLLVAYANGRLYDAERTAERRERYVAALESHRERFAESPTAGEASWMLARLHERRRQYTDALRAYLAIPVSHERGPAAGAAAGRMYETILALLRERNQPTAEWERSARTQLARYTETLPGLLEPLELDQALVALALARLSIGTDPRDYDAADELLERVAATWEAIENDVPPELEPAWRRAAREAAQLRIVAMAGRGHVEQATRLVDELAGADPTTLLEVLDGLTVVIGDDRGNLARQLGLLQLAAAADLDERRDSLDARTRRRLDVCRAEAFLATGQSRRAVPVYERLLADHPRDVALQRTIVDRLTECGRPECLKVAKPLWRRIERRAKEGTPPWFEARYRVAWSSLHLGELEECRKLLGITTALHPGLGGAEWAPRFERLRRELDATERR